MYTVYGKDIKHTVTCLCHVFHRTQQMRRGPDVITHANLGDDQFRGF